MARRRLEQTLRGLYSRNALAEAGQEALSVLKTLRALPPSSIAGDKAGYPEDELGNGLRQVALLMKSEVGPGSGVFGSGRV